MNDEVKQQTPVQLCDALEDAGWGVNDAGNFVGPKGQIDEALKGTLREQKAAVVAEWQKRQAAPRGFGVLPRRLPLGRVAGPRDFPDTAAMLLKCSVMAEYCFRQGPQVRTWLVIRAREYWNEFAQGDMDTMARCEMTACLDLVAWQQRATWAGALELVEGLNEAAEKFTKKEVAS